MINKKFIKIAVIDEFGENIGFLERFSVDDIEKMVHIAEENNMRCLAFVEIFEDTYFNEAQCRDIKKEELGILKVHDELNKDLLDALSRAVNLAIKESSYIKFEGF